LGNELSVAPPTTNEGGQRNGFGSLRIHTQYVLYIQCVKKKRNSSSWSPYCKDCDLSVCQDFEMHDAHTGTNPKQIKMSLMKTVVKKDMNEEPSDHQQI